MSIEIGNDSKQESSKAVEFRRTKNIEIFQSIDPSYTVAFKQENIRVLKQIAVRRFSWIRYRGIVINQSLQ